MFGFSGSFRDLDRFRLLIQRCKRVGEIGNFFDKGSVLPDESTRAPGEGYDRGRAWRSSADEGLWPDERVLKWVGWMMGRRLVGEVGEKVDDGPRLRGEMGQGRWVEDVVCGDRIKNEAATGVLFPWRQFFCQGQRSIFRLVEGSWMGWNHLDGFHFSRVFLPLASSKFFGFGLQYVSRFQMRYLHYSIRSRSTGFHQMVGFRWVFKK